MKRQVWYPAQCITHSERSVHKSSHYWLLCSLLCHIWEVVSRLSSGLLLFSWSLHQSHSLGEKMEGISGAPSSESFQLLNDSNYNRNSHSHFLNIYFCPESKCSQLIDAIDAVINPVTKDYHYPPFRCSNATDCVTSTTWEAPVRIGTLSNLLSLHYFPWA